jgi:hypothetical protein
VVICSALLPEEMPRIVAWNPELSQRGAYYRSQYGMTLAGTTLLEALYGLIKVGKDALRMTLSVLGKMLSPVAHRSAAALRCG